MPNLNQMLNEINSVVKDRGVFSPRQILKPLLYNYMDKNGFMNFSIPNQNSIEELFKLLNLTTREEADFPHFCDTSAPFEKCGITVHVPITVSNSTNMSPLRSEAQ
ncbi:MAG: hypothetical protein LBS62_07915 [Clostridiales bacterium]|jgi:hypothetical protein|nr:hypothetical protein [Clostridiales bacterium]